MLKTSGVFFNGHTSAPQSIELIFDEVNREFQFESSSGIYNSWLIDEVTLDNNEGSLSIQFGENPIQLINIHDAEFIFQLNKYRNEKGLLGWYHQLINLGIKWHLTIAIFIIGLIALIFLTIIPILSEKAASLIPAKFENEIGQTFLKEFLEYNSIDSDKTNALNSFVDQLQLNNTKNLKFLIVNSNTINAFSLPDGSIVVFTGIINKMQDYDELIGLIGHEVIHINNEHAMKMMCRNLSGYLFISAILSDINGIMAVIADNIRSLESLSYSRQFERQADIEGLELMILNNADPEGMSKLFMHLKSNSNNLVPGFLSTHPITDERIDYINKLIVKKSYQCIENPRLKELFDELKQ